MNGMAFQSFLQAQISNNFRRPASAIPPRLHHHHHHRDLRQLPLMAHQSDMQSDPSALHLLTQPSSFFEEALPYTGEQIVPADHLHRIDHDTYNVAFRPLWPASMPSSNELVALPTAIKQESSAELAFPGILGSHVDASQYRDVPADAWASVSVEYDASSPSSMDSFTTGPLTPATDEGGWFVDHFADTGRGLLSNAGPDYHMKQDGRMCHGLPIQSSESAWTGLASEQEFSDHRFSNAYANGDQTFGLLVGALRSPVAMGHSRPTIASIPHLSYPSLLYRAQSEAMASSTASYSRSPSSAARSQSPDAGPAQPAPPRTSSTLEELKLRRQKDELLLEMRKQNVSYKEIKRRGQFREAESTLRGRVRVLTKSKWERVRRPEWTKRDLRLLRAAVDFFSSTTAVGPSRASSRKLPWKKISVWIKENGGSYLFAPATCAKKWDEVHGVLRK